MPVNWCVAFVVTYSESC